MVMAPQAGTEESMSNRKNRMRSENVTSVTITEEAGSVAGRSGLSPGDLADLNVGEVANGGWCVARLGGTGPVVFVRHALPGERVRVRITEVTTRFARADAVEILAAAAGRVQPPCPYARPGACGGCDWQHASLPVQRELKASVVRQQLRRVAGIDWPVTVEALPGDEDRAGAPPAGAADGGNAGPPPGLAPPGEAAATPGLGWRTRVRFAVGGDGVAGLRAHRSHEVIKVTDCLIAHPGIRELGIPGRRWPRTASLEAVVASGDGERAVIVGGPSRPGGAARATLAQLTAESVLVAGQRRSAGIVLRGHAHLRERAAGRSWRVTAGGFWQVHPAAAGTLAGAVLDALQPQPGDTAVDLYCGAGLFAGVLADAVGPGGTVAGVEASTAAVRDARRNLRATPWASVYQGDAGELIARGVLPPARLTVLDPPRAGAARDVIDYLARPLPAGSGERRVGYVSCDPATLARDIALFAAHGWRLVALRAFDAFPMTHHVECLATLVSSG